MDPIARSLLERLLERAERALARGDASPASLALTQAQAPDYASTRNLARKREIEDAWKLARSKGAIDIDWDRADENPFALRLRVADAAALASFLGIRSQDELMREAREILAPHGVRHPAIAQVLERWAQLWKVRGRGPDCAPDFADAARVIDYIASQDSRADIYLRVASVALFGDSKRLEALAAPLDALTATSLSAPARAADEVFESVGLVRQPQPALLAGCVAINRTRAHGLLDQPYSGFPPQSVTGMGVELPRYILVVENLTTFHQVASLIQDTPALALYCAGMPSPAWRAMFGRLLAGCDRTMPVYHWGDIDPGGLRIARLLSVEASTHGFFLQPWLMDPSAMPGVLKTPAPAASSRQMAKLAGECGWADVAGAIERESVYVEQEAVSPQLPVFSAKAN